MEIDWQLAIRNHSPAIAADVRKRSPAGGVDLVEAAA
jgi:hypothetical protein